MDGGITLFGTSDRRGIEHTIGSSIEMEATTMSDLDGQVAIGTAAANQRPPAASYPASRYAASRHAASR